MKFTLTIEQSELHVTTINTVQLLKVGKQIYVAHKKPPSYPVYDTTGAMEPN